MRKLNIEDLKVGLLIEEKNGRRVREITYVSADNDVVHYDTGGWDFIFGEDGVLNRFVACDDMIEVKKLISSRSNGTYNNISDDASAIITTLGTDEYAYFFSQIANKLARIKHGYSVEDSLLDIAGYATLELEKLRGGSDE